MTGKFKKICVASVVMLITATLAMQASATPVSLTGSYSDSAGSISGNLQGDYAGNVLTLNSPLPANEVVVDLANPPIPVPSPIFSSSSNWCGFNCTVKAYLNESYTLNIDPWAFQVGGNVEFDPGNPLGGMANLTATPLTTHIGSFTGTVTPTFTVTAAKYDTSIVQSAADFAAASLQAVLNLGNWHVNVDGEGYWDSIDLGTITPSSTQNAGLTQLGLDFSNIMLSGDVGFNTDVTFDNSIVDAVGSSFINLFRNSIDSGLTAGLTYGIDHLSLLDYQTGEYSTDCGTTPTNTNSNYNIWLGISCGIGASFSGSARDVSVAPVPEPPTVGLFGLGLAGVFLVRRRRQRV